MNEKRHALIKTPSEIIYPPIFPIPGNKIFEGCAAALSATRGYSLNNRDFALITGRPKSTISHWFSAFPQPHLVALFCLLEQMPPPDRHRVIDGFCRQLPLIDHARLKHNPVVATTLKTLLRQSTGLSLLVGGTDEQRTFVLTALGHNFCRMDRRHRTASGIDLHQPDWFAPIETLLYLSGPVDGPQVNTLVRSVWPGIMRAKSPLILFNGIWSKLPECRADMVSLAARKHVVIADEKISVQRNALPKEHPLHVLSVSATRQIHDWISLETKRC